MSTLQSLQWLSGLSDRSTGQDLSSSVLALCAMQLLWLTVLLAPSPKYLPSSLGWVSGPCWALRCCSTTVSSTQRTGLKLKSKLQLLWGHIQRWRHGTLRDTSLAESAHSLPVIPGAGIPNWIPLAAFLQAAKTFCLCIVAIPRNSLVTSWTLATWFPSHNSNQTGLFSGKELSKEPWMSVPPSFGVSVTSAGSTPYCIVPFAPGELIPFCVLIFCYQLDLDLHRHMETQAKSFLWAHAISSADYSQQYLPLDKRGFQNWSTSRTMFPSQKLACFFNTLLLEALSAHGSLSQA